MKTILQFAIILACSFTLNMTAYAHCGGCGTGDAPKHDCQAKCKKSKDPKACQKKCEDHNKKEKKK